jgi:putative nucleotidyltransferase with HDIG domain
VSNPFDAALATLGRAGTELFSLAAGRRLFLVGGAVRDVLMGRTPADFDFAVSGSGVEFAAEFARRARGALVVLSEPDDEARVVLRRETVFDFNGLGERGIEEDIRRRDFTVNALAVEIVKGRCGAVIDIVGGVDDIAARVVRPVGPDSLERDPVRLLRGLRLGLELSFAVDAAVYEQGRRVELAQSAPERSGAELLRIMECGDSYPVIRRLYEIGRLAELLPELQPVLADELLREHSLKTYFKIEEIINRPGSFARFEPEWRRYFDEWGLDEPAGEEAAEPEPRAAQPYRRALLKLGGLLHDIAKPQTRFVNADGEMHFYGHDSIGARVVARIARERLRLSRRQGEMLASLCGEHMRLHLLATSRELTDRAIRRYWHDLGIDGFGLAILCIADGWATAGRTVHLEETIARMVGQQRDEAAKAAVKRLVTGEDLIAMGLSPGPVFKVILQELEDLQIEGRIDSKEAGLDYLRTHLASIAGGGK